MREVVIAQNNESIVIECRPTTPDVNVTLYGVCIIHESPETSVHISFFNEFNKLIA